jgi:DNA-binding transcriptional regulator YiaG
MHDLERTRQALADGTFRRLRLDAGLSQQAVERLYGVDRGNLSRYERGVAVPARPVTGLLTVVLWDLRRMARKRERAA